MDWLYQHILWIKSFHIFFVVCWFAGIFYLPRLFVNHAMTSEPAVVEQLLIMERKLYRFISPFAVLTVLLGLALVASSWDYYRTAGWLHAKITLVLILIGYHVWCGKLLADFAEGKNRRSHVFYRWFNEFPVILLLGIILLVVLRPF